ncbi:MAG: hypothetical protein WCP89_02280 [archaeon]
MAREVKKEVKGENVKKHGRAKKIILSIAIAIIFLLFIIYAIETFYKSPKYELYCNYTIPVPAVISASQCDELGGQWVNYSTPQPDYTNAKMPVNVTGYCDMYTKCNNEFQKVNEVHNRNVFFITLPIGIITIIVALILAIESVSVGFMAGGVFLIVYGTIRYWGALSDVWRTIMLGFALAVLVWIGYKKLK